MTVALVKEGWGLLSMFGLSSLDIAVAKAAGVQCSMATNGITFHGGSEATFVPIKPVTISLLKAGNIGASTKAATAAVLLEALGKATTDAAEEGDTGVPVPTPVLNPKNPGMTKPTEVPHGPNNASMAFFFVPPEGWAPDPGTVTLSEATDVHQTVTGTSAGAIYRVVIITSDLGVAFKVHGYKLSIRLEGALDLYKDALAGWPFDNKGDYWSAHLTIPMDAKDRKDVVARTMGALCSSIGFGKLVQVANIDTLFVEASW